MRDTEWMEHAECRGHYGLHFPESRGVAAYQQRLTAEAMCAHCPVSAECAHYVMASPWEEYGIWAGMSERSRNSLTRRPITPEGRNVYQRDCLICGGLFYGPKPSSLYCSGRCVAQAKLDQAKRRAS